MLEIYLLVIGVLIVLNLIQLNINDYKTLENDVKFIWVISFAFIIYIGFKYGTII